MMGPRQILVAFAGAALVSGWAALLGAGGAPARAVGGGAPSGATTGTALRCVVTLAPLRSLLEGMLPPGSSVTLLIPPGASEHGFEPTPGQLLHLGGADVVVRVGLGLEPGVANFLEGHPRADRHEVVFATAVGLEDAGAVHDCGDHGHIPTSEHEAHAHAHDHDHSDHAEAPAHDASDPHLWLSPTRVLRLIDVQEGAVLHALAQRGVGDDDEHPVRAQVRASAARLRERVRAMDAWYRATLDTARADTLITGHEAFGLLAGDYGLRVAPLTGLGAGEPTLAAIQRAGEVIERTGVRSIFAEPQLPADAIARLSAATGARVLMLDPLGSGDWFALMEANLRALADGLEARLAPRPEVLGPPSAPNALEIR